MSDSDTPEQTMSEDDNHTTDSTETRWEGLNTVLTLVLVFSLPAIIGYVLVTGTALSAIAQVWFALYATTVLMAATWAFGKETLEAVQQARGK